MRWLLLFLIGCSATEEAPPLGAALARVNGQTIAPAEVEALVRATGRTPREALHDLVSERLLVGHSQAYERSPAVAHGVEQALVQRLLAVEIGPGDPEQQRVKLEQLLARLTAEGRVRYQDAAIERAFAPAR